MSESLFQQSCRPLLEKETPNKCFPVDFVEFLRTALFLDDLRSLLAVFYRVTGKDPEADLRLLQHPRWSAL